MKAPLKRLWKSKAARLIALGFAIAMLLVGITGLGLALTSSPSFCMSCHEMRVVAEQGWMHSKHYNNRGGVVAGCSDCHVPPGLFAKLWVKTRDGLKDTWVHFFGQSDPTKMDWEALGKSARGKIYQSACEKCHQNLEPEGASIKALVAHRENKRAETQKTCLDCHRARGTDKDAMDCPGTKGKADLKITPIVSPAKCSRCHPREAEQFAKSKHARTWDIMTKELKDPWLRGMNNEIERATGCFSCHGTDISDGKLTAENWPNQGVGRLNPDGSKGSCVACHTTHRFSIAEARKPENCGQCHMGPDHPQDEIYFESKHGKIYLAEKHKWNFEAAPDAWEPHKDFRAPTCAACHMAGIGPLATTHDVGERLKWEAQLPALVKNKDHDPDAARKKMATVCVQCHSPRWANNYLDRYDKAMDNYGENYFRPAKALMDDLYAKKLLTAWPVFDEEIEFVYYELWHNEGRRARMGAAMMGPDFAWWHGFYELKKHYNKFVHLAEKVKQDGHGCPVYVPGAGGKNLTPAESAPLPGGWLEIKGLKGLPKNE